MRALRARTKLFQRGLAVLILPISIVPFLLIGPSLVESHHIFKREHDSGPLAAPQVVLSPGELAYFKPLPAFSGKVPVLAYRGLSQKPGSNELTQRAFARQLAILSHLGFRSVSIRQFARFRRGEPAGLPPRPVLITFDGGRLDSFRAADRVLQRYGFRATMFVSAGEVQQRSDDYLTWRELHAMRDSGRWDVQAASTRAQPRVVVDPAGDMKPAYAYRRWTRSSGEETFADWQQRVTKDVFDAHSALVAQGFDPVAFAIPGGDYGQAGSNDPRIAPYLRSLLSAQFDQALIEGANPGYAARAGDASRLEVRASTTTGDVYRWLARRIPKKAVGK